MQAVKRTFGALLQADRARPEAARRIALAVVEAVVRQVGLGVRDLRARAGRFIEEVKPIVARPHEATLRTRHHGAHALADIPDRLGFRLRIEGEDLVRFDVHVEQTVGMPNRAFAPDGDVVADGFGGDHEMRGVLEGDRREATGKATGCAL